MDRYRQGPWKLTVGTSSVDFEEKTIAFANPEELSHELAHVRLGIEADKGHLEGELRAWVYATAKGWYTDFKCWYLSERDDSTFAGILEFVARGLLKEGKISKKEFSSFVRQLRHVEKSISS